MSRAHDVKFRVNSGDHNGDEYGFTLAIIEGKKAFTPIRLFNLPPSMIREQIIMTFTAREGNIPLSGAAELKAVHRILEQIETLSVETDPLTLTGLDQIPRLVRVDAQGAKLIPVVHELGKDPEYRVELTCWGLYEPEE